MEKQKDKKLTKKLWLQAGGLILTTLMSWAGFAGILLIPEMICVFFKENSYFYFDEYVMFELKTLIFVLFLSSIVIGLLFLLRAELNDFFRTHMLIGFIANIACYFFLIIYEVDLIYNKYIKAFDGHEITQFDIHFTYFMLNIFWIIAALSLIVEIILLMVRRIYKQPKAFIIFLFSNVGINIFILYLAKLYLIWSSI